jgi:hypothetical protein
MRTLESLDSALLAVKALLNRALIQIPRFSERADISALIGF